MESTKLQKIISRLPTSSGVYLFKGSRGELLYVGKATHLKSRVLAYAKTTDVRLQAMVSEASDLDHRTTNSDIEALILESQLIKRHQPKFNIMLRDDKQYFFVAFTKEVFPRIFLTHQPAHKDIEYIGPFTEGAPLKTTLRSLRRLFPYCTCKQLHNVKCLNAHIGKCLGICCLKSVDTIEKEKAKNTYRHNIQTIKNLLNGKRTSVIKDLEKEMKEKATHGEFEEALELQNKISKIQRVFENAQIIKSQRDQLKPLFELKKILGLPATPIRIEGYDISNISGIHATGSLVVFENGQPDKNFYRKFKIKTIKSSDDTAMLREVITRRLNHPEWPYPDLMLIDGGKGQLNAVLSVISNFQFLIPKQKPTIIALTKNDKHMGNHLTTKVGSEFKIIPLTKLPESVRNLILTIDSEAHRFAISYYRKLHRKNLTRKSLSDTI